MSATLKLSWVLCAVFSLTPSAYVLWVTYLDVRSGGISWGWMLIGYAVIAYAVVLVLQILIAALTPRPREGWRQLAVV